MADELSCSGSGRGGWEGLAQSATREYALVGSIPGGNNGAGSWESASGPVVSTTSGTVTFGCDCKISKVLSFELVKKSSRKGDGFLRLLTRVERVSCWRARVRAT